ncbi:MAG: NCS2 family permease [Bacteroidales bacterium]
MLEKIFKLKEHNTTPRAEIIGGITTFMTMAYILIVNPSILAATGMDKDAVFTATALSAVVGCFMMGLFANLPIGLAPGMGLNAFFAYTVVLQMGYSWEMALAAVFIEGIIFILLTVFNIREAIVKAIPPTMKLSISVGIGLFITTIGFVNSGIIVQGNALSKLGNLTEPGVYLTLLAVLITGALLIKKVKGALLWGIIATTVIGIPLGIVSMGADFKFFSFPPSLKPVFMQMDFSRLFSIDMLVIVLTFIFMDLFDTAGTLIAVCTKTNLIKPDGNIKNSKQAFLSDAVATTAGAVLGTSTVTSFVESAAGVAAGGRTGLTAIVTGILFLLSLFFAPLFNIVPTAATSAALIIVGLFMITLVSSIDFEDYKNAIPAFVTIIITPLSYSIADGIIFGVLTYVGLHLFAGDYKKIGIPMYVLAAVFLAKVIFLA